MCDYEHYYLGYQKLKEENEKLKEENKWLEFKAQDAKECAKLIARNATNEIAAIQKENEKLKAENEHLQLLKNQLINSIETIGFSYNPQKEACKFLKERSDSLEDEIKQLKAQLQNCDKASQVENKPHKCPACDEELAQIYYCQVCHGRGIVWEEK